MNCHDLKSCLCVFMNSSWRKIEDHHGFPISPVLFYVQQRSKGDVSPAFICCNLETAIVSTKTDASSLFITPNTNQNQLRCSPFDITVISIRPCPETSRNLSSSPEIQPPNWRESVPPAQCPSHKPPRSVLEKRSRPKPARSSTGCKPSGSIECHQMTITIFDYVVLL